MKISIITVCYNSEKTIQQTIESVLSQDYQNIEYIIIDGKSSDRTMSIIFKYFDKIHKIITEEDKGIYDAINKGIQIATGEYIVLLNSNDVFFSKETVSNIAKFHDTHNCCISFGDVIYKNDTFEISRYYSSKYWMPFFLKLGYMPPHQASVIRTNIYRTFGNYSLNYKIAADYDVFVRFILKHRVKYKVSNEIRTIMSEGGVSSQGLKSYFLITSEISKIFGKENNLFYQLIISLRFIFKYISSLYFKKCYLLKKRNLNRL